MKPSEVKQENQLQQWSMMVRQQKESGLTVKQWCSDQGISKYAFYDRRRKLRQVACTALEEAQPVQLVEVPLSEAAPVSGIQLQIKLSRGTVELSNADPDMLERILRVMMYAE